jgi:uncharacterized membrane protein
MDAKGQDVSFSRRVSFWLKQHYLAILAIILALYVGLPLLAPVLMKTGQQNLAQSIYNLYKPLCHQLAYRSFFFFGEQSVYPLKIAEIEGLKTYEEVAGLDGADLHAAQELIGNEEMGYKTALCQRDVAIYLSLFLFVLIFWLSGRRIKPLPWVLWILLALVPMGLDGVSQLISRFNISGLNWLAIRESTPFLRVLTGSMFGLFSAWFGIPSINEMMEEATLPSGNQGEA